MKSENGQSAVELALLTPFIVILMLCVIDFGMFLYQSNTTNYLAQEAARVVSLESVDTLTDSEVEDAIGNDSVQITVSRTKEGPGGIATVTVTRSMVGAYILKTSEMFLDDQITYTSTIRIE